MEVAWSYVEILRFELNQLMPELHKKMQQATKEKEAGNQDKYESIQNDCSRQFQKTNTKVLKYLKISQDQFDHFVTSWQKNNPNHEIVSLNDLIRNTHAACLQQEDTLNNNKPIDISIEKMLESLKFDKYEKVEISVEVYKEIVFKFYAFLRH